MQGPAEKGADCMKWVGFILISIATVNVFYCIIKHNQLLKEMKKQLQDDSLFNKRHLQGKPCFYELFFSGIFCVYLYINNEY